MSFFFDPFQRPVAVMDEAHMPLLLANLCIHEDRSSLWLNMPVEWRQEIVRMAGLDWSDLMRRSALPSFGVRKHAELGATLRENMIYKTEGTYYDHYYLEILQVVDSDEVRLFGKYNTILGSRLLLRPDQGFVLALKVAYAALLQASIKAPKAAIPARVTAPKKPRTEQEEVSLLLLDGDVIKLPTEQLIHYAKLKARIEKAGGSYNSRGHFDFPAGISAAEVLEAMKSGKTVNGKKSAQFFRTPKALAEVVCRAAGLDASRRVLEPAPALRVLEPSAGDGALADIARAAGAEVVVVENWAPNVLALKAKGYDVIDRSFLDCSPRELGMFDVIVANPPFTRNMDIEHVEHMWEFLREGGCLSVLMSTSWIGGSQRRQALFQEFLEQHGASIERVEPGAFKESGTNVAVTHVVVRKPVGRTKVAPAQQVEQLELV